MIAVYTSGVVVGVLGFTLILYVARARKAGLMKPLTATNLLVFAIVMMIVVIAVTMMISTASGPTVGGLVSVILLVIIVCWPAAYFGGYGIGTLGRIPGWPYSDYWKRKGK